MFPKYPSHSHIPYKSHDIKKDDFNTDYISSLFPNLNRDHQLQNFEDFLKIPGDSKPDDSKPADSKKADPRLAEKLKTLKIK